MSRLRSLPRWLIWILVGLILSLVAFFVLTGKPLVMPLIERSFRSVAYDYTSPYLAPLAPGPAGPRLVPGRVVIVVVDGLRQDTSRQDMPGLNALRERGADLTAVTGEPSLSYPGWTVIGSGAWQEVSGVVTNYYSGTVKLDNLFQEARSKGLKTAVVGAEGWRMLYRDWLDVAEAIQEPADYRDVAGAQAADAEALRRALALLQGAGGSPRPDLLLVHFPGVDHVSHGYGVGREARETAAHVDGLITQLAAALDLSQDALVITADHGHIGRGGHGGWEPEVKTVPLVFVGRGIQPGTYPQARQADIAPTVAALLGLPMPAFSQGKPLLGLLQADPAQKGLIGQAAAIQLATFYDTYYQTVSQGRDLGGPFAQAVRARYQARIESGDAQALDDYVRELETAAANVRERRLASERQGRLPLAVLLALLPLAYFVFRRPSRDWLLPLAGAALYFILFNFWYFLILGYRWSLTAFNTEADIVPFIEGRVIQAAVFMLLAALAVGALARRRPAGTTAALGMDTLFLIGYALVLQILTFYWQWGVSFSWTLPDLRLGFKYYVDLIQLGAMYLPIQAPFGLPLALLMPLVALAGWGLARLVANLRARRIIEEQPAGVQAHPGVTRAAGQEMGSGADVRSESAGEERSDER